MITLKDVAERAGVTVTTVSRVLNNRGYISEKTRKRVYEVMRELNYQPNEVARSLTKKRSNFIGVIVPSVHHPFFGHLVYHLERCASEKGYKILLCNSESQMSKELEYIEMLKSNQVAGMVIASRTLGIEDNVESNMPVAMIERQTGGRAINICCDNQQGGELAAGHLIDAGCKKLVYISGDLEKGMPGDLRIIGFEQVCSERRVRYQIYSTREKDFYTREYHGIIEQVLNENPDADGIFASNDIIAAQIIQVCTRRGIRIPEEIRIIGFDDIELCGLCTPTITTIRQPVAEMAELAIRNIHDRLQDKVVATRTVLPVQLVVRESS